MTNPTYYIVRVTTQSNRQTAEVAAENMTLDQANSYLYGVARTASRMGQEWKLEPDCYIETQLDHNPDLLRNNIQYIIEVA